MENDMPTAEQITCKNCDTDFSGNFCPHCGQSIKDYDKPFGFIIYDLMGNIFAFDTRLWRTFVAILFKPGKMAQEFIKGHRVRYMPPFRFYVFVSFIFFLMLNYSTLASINFNNNDVVLGEESKVQRDSVKKEIALVVDSLLTDSVITKDHYNTYKKTLDVVEGVDDNRVVEKLKEAAQHPEYYIPQLIKYLSWSLFLLMPLYGAMLWLFFHKKHKYYLGHLIFSINQHSFLFVVFIIIMTINRLFPDKQSAYEGWLMVLVPIYSIIGGRKLYLRKWRTVFFKLTAIFFMYSFLLLIALIVALFVVFV